MSEIITDLVWYPPVFPAKGRLPTHASLVGKNCDQQDSQELAYRQELCLAAGRRVAPPCCKTLHISLFFDGTGNNLNHDFYNSDPKHPTNIVRLFRAAIGKGYAGGVDGEKLGLLDVSGSSSNNYYKYYLPGIGTPFPEIKDLDFSMLGLAAATHGEDRINWGLLRLIDALRRTMTEGKQTLSNGECWGALEKMATSRLSFGLTGKANRESVFRGLLKKLSPELRKLLIPAGPGQPKLLGIKLYVYGFSRGAATARTFVNWLCQLLPAPEQGKEKAEQCLVVGDLKIPLSIEFLGLFDTVASVGIAHIAPLAEGHMSWADGTQQLPDDKIYGGLIKKCVHLVSSHEQRLCFPMDSIRRADGKYPANSVEVVYPGMHSDLGGGYPPGDQGKANADNDSCLLSQIALNEMYAAAFKAGAPLKVPEEVLPGDLQNDEWRKMHFDLGEAFEVAPELVNRFNAWRELTLGQTPPAKPISAEQAAQYDPLRAPVSLEKAIENQTGWLTAWRIHRYAGGSYTQQNFFIESGKNDRDKDRDPMVRKQSEEKRQKDQKYIEDERKKMLIEKSKDEDFLLLPQGAKDFDAALAQTQLRQAADEFREDYHRLSRNRTGNWVFNTLDAASHAVFLLNNDNEYGEWLKIKTDGDQRVKQLFPDAGEAGNASQPGGLVRALFDDQVHDSRAWFMHSTLGSREPWGGYLLYRMVYFGSRSSKPMTPLMIAGAVVGAATIATGVGIIIKQKSVQGTLAGVAGIMGATYLETQAIDLLSGKPIPMLASAAQLQTPTMEPGKVVAEQTRVVEEQELAQIKALIEARWAEYSK